MDFMTLIASRRSVRKYAAKAVEPSLVEKCARAASTRPFR